MVNYLTNLTSTGITFHKDKYSFELTFVMAVC